MIRSSLFSCIPPSHGWRSSASRRHLHCADADDRLPALVHVHVLHGDPLLPFPAIPLQRLDVLSE